MTREIFRKSGGFPEIAIMEDFALVSKLRKLGRIKILPATVVTSGRRWRELGIFRATVLNQVLIGGYLLGLSPASLASWARRSAKAP
jgi:GT2 family glycosyltransferase